VPRPFDRRVRRKRPVTAAGFRQPGSVEHIDAAFLADRAAIQDLIAAFGLYFDAGAFDELAELLTEDARYEIVPAPEPLPSLVTTREKIVREMAALWHHNRENLGAHQRHVTTNTVVLRSTATTAEARSLLTATLAHEDDRHVLRRTGGYTDVLRKADGRWRIAHRRVHLAEVPGPAPTAPPA
jgi:3-phenylpropionate/cinnamic acid dioxygenase small subunit